MTILKGLVACLALANLLYFLWTHGIAATQDGAAAPAAPSRTLQLASESAAPARARPEPAGPEPAAPDSAAPAAADGTTPTGPVAGLEHCVTVGPFRDPAQAAHAAAMLRAGGFAPREHVVGKAYWIDVDIKSGDGFPSPAELEGGAARSTPLGVKACPAETAPPGAGAAL